MHERMNSPRRASGAQLEASEQRLISGQLGLVVRANSLAIMEIRVPLGVKIIPSSPEDPLWRYGYANRHCWRSWRGQGRGGSKHCVARDAIP